jgi:Asp-tRNA(Asn)/Glu-tRNA(Gln) amidotransferase A subunit family amidase
MSALHALSLSYAAQSLEAGRVSAADYARALLARVDATDADIEAWAYLDRGYVLDAARRLDALPASRRGPLHAIPVGLKDIIHTFDLPTGMGTPACAGFAAPADAACVRRLVAAGGYAFGKTVTTELAFMQPGKTRNPWNARHTPGGSSQGSAAAVAAGHVPAALGTQTNGSVIRPAAYCGVVGFKPTLGAIPFDGVGLFSHTLDTVGTLTRSVEDAALIASAVANAGAIEPRPLPLASTPRFVYVAEFPWVRVDCGMAECLDAAATRLREVGAIVDGMALPAALESTTQVLRTIMLYEAARNLGPLQARSRGELSPTLNAALDEGRAIAAHDYARASSARAAMIGAAGEWLRRYDALIVPSAPAGAPEGLNTTGDPSCCSLASLLGAPAVTLPIGRDAHGLPLGMQVVALPGNDSRLLAIAAWCEKRLPFAGLV